MFVTPIFFMIKINFIFHILNRNIQLKRAGFFVDVTYFTTNINIFLVKVKLVYNIQNKFLKRIYKFLVSGLKLVLYLRRNLIIMINIDLDMYVQNVLLNMVDIFMSEEVMEMYPILNVLVCMKMTQVRHFKF